MDGGGMKTCYSDYRMRLLDKPSVTATPCCVVCGRPATNCHHVIPKGMGGVPRETEKRIPKLKLCGNGNLDGCHGLAHQGRLHLNWDGNMGGWVFYVTEVPMNDEAAWRMFGRDYLPVPGWSEMQHPTMIFGRGI